MVPAFYNKPIKDHFTKRVIFNFNEANLTIEVFNLKSDALEERSTYLYQNIRACSVSVKQDKYSALILRSTSGKTERFTFVDNAEDSNSSETIYHLIISATKNLPETHKVALEPHFYGSKTGTRILYSMVVLMIIFIIWQLFYYRKALPISFLTTIILFVVILVKRSANIDKRS